MALETLAQFAPAQVTLDAHLADVVVRRSPRSDPLQWAPLQLPSGALRHGIRVFPEQRGPLEAWWRGSLSHEVRTHS